MSSKSAVAAVLLFAMLWQAMAWLVPDARSRHAEQLAHVLVHAQSVHHHHLFDEALCLESAGAVAPHEHESGVQPGILIAATVAVASPPPPSVPMALARGAKPSIVPEGPLRPPRA